MMHPACQSTTVVVKCPRCESQLSFDLRTLSGNFGFFPLAGPGKATQKAAHEKVMTRPKIDR